MLPKGVTLRGLEVFEAVAATGSVAEAAARTALSQPAVSQQLRNLEEALGAPLVDHARRPMRLTQAGRSFLTRAQNALAELRQAQHELTVMDLSHVSKLNLGVIDDFEQDLTPRLVSILAHNLTQCRFKLVSAPSHDILKAMERRDLHVAVAASDGDAPQGVVEYPLLRDPYILVAPKGRVAGAGDVATLMERLPFLRYDREQFIGRQVDAHLARLNLSFPERFELGSHLSLMTLVAHGVGWAVSTPLGYLSAVRLHSDIEAHPFPGKPFARQISLFAGTDWAGRIPQEIARTLRHLAAEQVIAPAVSRLPWLEKSFRVLGDEEANSEN